MDQIEIRSCASIPEYEECVRVEHATWGEEITVPSAIFVVAHHTGGQVIGAFDQGKMIGFTLALAGVRSGKPFLHSHMTAVMPEFRDRGVGRRLKLFQRQDALRRGITLIEWTFDPLEFRNAHFNLVRLGAVARRYIPNCYGITASPLHAGLPTDRLVAEWWIDSARVKSILADDLTASTASAARIPLPANIDVIRANDREAALRIQGEARERFTERFAEGFVATAVELSDVTMDYVLEQKDAIAGLRLPEIKES
ncbi:MAG TPA: GNAT family N-acetyltransferase [Candidatus Acidoferrales bacterium]|nr:GNAT family N-acetyltransferase [Candidatus Acidoferrales bacterium]